MSSLRWQAGRVSEVTSSQPHILPDWLSLQQGTQSKSVLERCSTSICPNATNGVTLQKQCRPPGMFLPHLTYQKWVKYSLRMWLTLQMHHTGAVIPFWSADAHVQWCCSSSKVAPSWPWTPPQWQGFFQSSQCRCPDRVSASSPAAFSFHPGWLSPFGSWHSGWFLLLQA